MTFPEIVPVVVSKANPVGRNPVKAYVTETLLRIPSLFVTAKTLSEYDTPTLASIKGVSVKLIVRICKAGGVY